MDFHQLPLIRFSNFNPTKGSNKQNIKEKEKICQIENNTSQPTIRSKYGSKTVTKVSSTGIKTKTRLDRHSRSDTIVLPSLKVILQNLGCRKSKSFGDIKKLLTHKKKVSSQRISQTLQKKSDPKGKRDNSENDREIRTIFSAPKQSGTKNAHSFGARPTSSHQDGKVSKNLRLFDLYSYKVTHENYNCPIHTTYRVPRKKRSKERNICICDSLQPTKAIRHSRSDTGLCPPELAPYGYKWISALRSLHIPSICKVRVCWKASNRLYQNELDMVEMDSGDHCSLDKQISGTNVRLSLMMKKCPKSREENNLGGDSSLCCSSKQIVKMQAHNNAATSTNKRTVCNKPRVKRNVKIDARLPCKKIGMDLDSVPSLCEQTRATSPQPDWRPTVDSHGRKGTPLSKNPSLLIYYASKVLCKLHKISPFFTKDPITTRRVLKCIFFCVIVLVWSPCIIPIILSWLISYPLKPDHLRSPKQAPKCQSGKGNVIVNKFETIWPNFSGWMKRMTHSNLSLDSILKKSSSTLNGKLSSQTSKKRLFSSKLSNLPQSHPNPARKYTLFHATGRGWLIKPIPKEEHKRQGFRHALQDMFHRTKIDDHRKKSAYYTTISNFNVQCSSAMKKDATRVLSCPSLLKGDITSAPNNQHANRTRSDKRRIDPSPKRKRPQPKKTQEIPRKNHHAVSRCKKCFQVMPVECRSRNETRTRNAKMGCSQVGPVSNKRAKKMAKQAQTCGFSTRCDKNCNSWCQTKASARERHKTKTRKRKVNKSATKYQTCEPPTYRTRLQALIIWTKQKITSLLTRLWRYVQTKIDYKTCLSLNDTDEYLWSKKQACHNRLYVGSMRKKPCFWLFRLCPSCYPAFMNCRQSCRSCSQNLGMCVFSCLWFPLFCCCYLCYFCCSLCMRFWCY